LAVIFYLDFSAKIPLIIAVFPLEKLCLNIEIINFNIWIKQRLVPLTKNIQYYSQLLRFYVRKIANSLKVAIPINLTFHFSCKSQFIIRPKYEKF